jgi:hypothetical protein
MREVPAGLSRQRLFKGVVILLLWLVTVPGWAKRADTGTAGTGIFKISNLYREAPQNAFFRIGVVELNCKASTGGQATLCSPLSTWTEFTFTDLTKSGLQLNSLSFHDPVGNWGLVCATDSNGDKICNHDGLSFGGTTMPQNGIDTLDFTGCGTGCIVDLYGLEHSVLTFTDSEHRTLTVMPPAVCFDPTFSGVFGFSYGRLAGSERTSASMGQFTADGQGGLKGSWTQSVDGVITQSETFTGAYSISNNCTGSMAFNNQDGSTSNFNIVVDDGAKGFQMIRTDAGHTQPGFGSAQGTAACGLPGKKQVLAVNLFGTLTASGEPEAVVGEITLDGKGNVSGTATFSINFVNHLGVSVQGTYSQNATDCEGTLRLTSGVGGTMNFNTVAVNGGAELLLLETDNDTLIAGTAQQ